VARVASAKTACTLIAALSNSQQWIAAPSLT
jgi:hypothetical protein